MTDIFEETKAYTYTKTEELPQNVAGGDKKIMIVDDDPAVTELIEKNLAKNGFILTICHDTGSAEKMLQKEQPDLIVLDIIFPTGDGIEFCRRIRSNPQWETIPVIFLTVKGELQDKLAGFSTGADDYLCKPFKVEELVARIHVILNRMVSCKELILQDELTKVYNRRYLQQCLTHEIAKAQQNRGSFSLAIIDVDFFKNVNDRYGHLAGDEALQCLADKLVRNLRATDVVCRYGGDEFVILMPETSQAAAYKILERVRRLIADELQQLPKTQVKIPLTISMGVVSYPEQGTSEEELLKKSDILLYRAKEGGRNRVKIVE
jgi:diguanylate cyclase (GGDEF)-like protein